MKPTHEPDWVQADRDYIWHPYTQMQTAPPPLPVVRGEGSWLITSTGDRYLDAVSSWWTNIHGHAHPYLAKAIYQQALTLQHVIFAGFTHQPAAQLAARLVEILPDNQSRVFYSDNGSTAVEIGLKMALQYFHNLGQARPGIVAFEHGFHGETFGAMSASSDLSFNRAFHGHLFQVERIPPPLPGQEAASLAALKKIIQQGDMAAFIFEPLLMGAGGMLMYEAAALDRLLAVCREAGVICIADEVMTGFGRTGSLFASEMLAVPPDIMCLAKGLSGGSLPLAITSCSAFIYEAFLSEDKYKTFFHGHSFTANPLGCAVGLASMDLLLSDSCQQQRHMIEVSHRAFAQKIRDKKGISQTRVQGTVLAVEYGDGSNTGYFNELRDQLYTFFLDRKLLLRPLGNVIYCMPPYCISAEELEMVYTAMEEARVQFFAD